MATSQPTSQHLIISPKSADLIDVLPSYGRPSRDPTSDSPPWISPPVIVTGPCTSLDAPPPFHDLEDDPAPPYQQTNQNPETLARYLFRFGFIFPLFWVLGASIIFAKLHPIPYTISGKSPSEQEEELAILRTTELKWAWRSFYALSIWIVFVGFLCITIVTCATSS